MNGIDLNKIMNEYKLPDYDNVLFEYDDELLNLFNGIEKLEQSEKILLLLYAELRSYRKVAKLIGCSYTLLYGEIKRIKRKLGYE